MATARKSEKSEKSVKTASKLQAFKSNKIIYIGDAQRVIRVDELTAIQLKIAMFTASQVGPDDTAETLYKMTYRQFAGLCGLSEETNGGENYKRVFDEAEKLLNLGLRFVDADGSLVGFNWLAFVQVTPKKGELNYSLSSGLLPFYKTRQASFAIIPLSDYMPLRSKYSLMLYEFLAKWKNAGQVYQTIAQLREQLQISPEIHKRIVDLRRLIETCVAEINATAINGFTVKITEKRGQRENTEGITFVITPVGVTVQPISQDVINLVDLLKASGVSAMMVKSLVGN